MIDTIAGADASANIYSIAETVKANNLKPYDYFEYLLIEIPKHMDEHDTSFCEELLPWSSFISGKLQKATLIIRHSSERLSKWTYPLWCVYNIFIIFHKN